MREIKFRGKQGGSWCYAPSMEFTLGEFFQFVDAKLFDPATVGQWTGLKDCKGVDIYEGDVVKWENDLNGDSAELTIRWTQYNTCFQMCDDVNRKYFLALSGECARNSTVIGNIHEVTI